MLNGAWRNLEYERGGPAHPMRIRNNHRLEPNQKTRLAQRLSLFAEFKQ